LRSGLPIVLLSEEEWREDQVASVLGPQPKDVVKLSRELKFPHNRRVKAVGGEQPASLPKGTKGIVTKVQGTLVTVDLDWYSRGDLTIMIDKTDWATTFEEKSSDRSEKFSFAQAVKVDSKIKVLTRAAAMTEIPKGASVKVDKLSGRRVKVSVLVPGNKTPVDVEFDIEHFLRVAKPA
jgi:hypothetical protein